MINSKSVEYYQNYGAGLIDYLRNKEVQSARWNYIIAFIVLCILLATLFISRPIFALSDINEKISDTSKAQIELDLKENFKKYIINKYPNANVYFPSDGVAHIKKVKYINSKPIKINIVELNTNVNPYLKIKPQIASSKLNSKTTVKRIAQKEGALIAINGGFFKPNTGVPLGALMIDNKVLTGPIYNRVGIAIFEKNDQTIFKMDNIEFNISIHSKNHDVKIDNINQPRMLQSHTLLYTPSWGTFSPVAPKTGYNLLIKDGKFLKISANPIEFIEGSVVLSANKEIVRKLALDGAMRISFELQENLKGAKHIIAAGPYLVKDSEIFVDVKTQKLDAIAGKNPRSAVGFRNDGTFMVVTIDGREEASVGMTLYELAKLMKSLGCEYAMNFDGGSSSALYVKGKIVNDAVNKEGIAVSNALIVHELVPTKLTLSSL